MRDAIETALYEREKRLEKWLQTLPICDCCGEPIQDEGYHDIPKFGKICDSCLDDFWVWID